MFLVPLDDLRQEFNEIGAGVTVGSFAVYFARFHVKRCVEG